MKNYLMCLFALKICAVCSYNILIFFPVPLQSHYFLGNALGKGLANAGHEVTMVSPFEEKDPPKKGKYHQIVLNGAQERMVGNNFPSWMEIGEMNVVKMELQLLVPAVDNLNFTLHHPKFQKLIDSGEKFDVIIIEQFLNDAFKILSCHFNAPIIAFSTLPPNFWVNPAVGNPSPPSYIPDIFLGYTSRMTFSQRTVNSLFTLFKYYARDYLYMPTQLEYIKKHFPKCRSEADNVLYNASLTFINYHESINYPVPLVPNMIPIGGIHFNPSKKLPKHLQDFMDQAKEGVIYFSLGSNVPTWMINDYTKKALINALGKRKEKVVMKWDEDNIPNKPDNLNIQKWFPQQEILAHPNMKVFITHGGLLSTMETVYHGVPVLALPVFADQKLNGQSVENGGYGLSILLSKLTEKKLSDSLDKLINDPQYQENVKKRSALIRDRPIHPLDLAIYWTEFVAKYKGAPHLRVAGADLKWYEYFLIDVIATVTLIIFFIIMIFFLLIKSIWKVVRGNKKIKKQ